LLAGGRVLPLDQAMKVFRGDLSGQSQLRREPAEILPPDLFLLPLGVIALPGVRVFFREITRRGPGPLRFADLDHDDAFQDLNRRDRSGHKTRATSWRPPLTSHRRPPDR